MSALYIITSFLFFIWLFRNILFWVWLWQLKEYRLDRVIIHLRETGQGRKLFFSPLSILKWLAFIFTIAVIFYPKYITVAQIYIAGVYAIQAVFILREFFYRLYKRPVFTFKALIILFLVFASISLSYFIPLFEDFLWLVFLDRITPFAVAFFVFLFYFPTELYRDWKIEKAAKELRHHKKVSVIGITGSYGKSSTKEYLSQILEKKFKVLKTKGTNNTPIGIANTILYGLRKDTEILVAEMGAYKIGEIAEMCQIVNPKIGILTAVNEQHLSLFGSLQNTIKAKYELIEALPKHGLAIFNGNNEITRKLYEETEKDKALYLCLEKIESKTKKNADITAFNIITNKYDIEFDVMINDKTVHFKTPLLGAHNVNNILPGIYVANKFGMKITDIQEAVAGLTSLPQTMIYKEGPKGATIIDDSFNANPEAVLAAMDYAKIYKGKKILVLQPMIELGGKAAKEHYRVAKEISNTCDYLFLTNRNFYKSISRGIIDGKGKCEVKVAKVGVVLDFIVHNITKGDVIVFEGKEAGTILNKLKV